MPVVCLLHALLLLFNPGAATAQVALDFSAYVADLPFYQHLRPELADIGGIKQDQAQNLTRLRLRPVMYLWDGGRLALEYEVSALSSTERITSLAQTDGARRQNFSLLWQPVAEDHIIIQHFIDRLFLKHSGDGYSLRIGRQRISWGTGRIWNPTDVFNPINPATFTKIEKDGADAITIKLFPGNFTDLELVYNPENDWKVNNFAARFRTNVAEFDMAVMAGKIGGRLLAGADFAGNVFDAGLRGEALFSAEQDELSEGFVKAVLGADYQFTPDFYALFEYHFNGEGASDRAEYDVLRLFRGEILNLAQHYAHLQGNYQVHPLVTLSLSFNINMNDSSVYAALLGNYSINDEASLSLGGQVFFGETLDEYWYYPHSVYLQLQWFF